jgi:predicted amidohydrolase YtcJ
LSASPGFREGDLERFDAVRLKFPDDPLLKSGAVKIMLDGVVESHTAAMLAPYANRKTNGQLNLPPEQLNRVVALLDKAGWQVMIHAIGDAGIRAALDAFAHATTVNAAPERGRRHRIEHIETLDPDDLPRFAALGVIAALQPYHGSPAPNQIAVWKANLGEPRASRAWLYKSLLDSGARVIFGSDWPVVSMDPRQGLHVATTRTALDGEPAAAWLPGQRVTLSEAIDAHTSTPAWASFDEHRKGTLAPGMLADIVILTSDIFAPGAKLLDTRVAKTVFDGRVVFDRERTDPTDE